MMNLNYRFYYKSADGVYNRSVWSYLFPYVAIFFVCDSVSLIVLKFVPVGFVRFLVVVFSAGFLISLLIWLVYTIYRSHQNKSFFKYVSMNRLEDSIAQALVDTASLKRLKDVTYLRAPKVLCIWKDDQIRIEVGKIAGLEENSLDSLCELINSSLTGKYKNFAVSSRLVSDDQLEFVFYAEDVASDETWIPQTIDDLRQKPYVLRLQKNLEINLADMPNVGIWGATGSGKSTVVFACVAQLLSNDTKLLFLDGKSEYSALSTFYPSNLFLTDADEIENALKDVVENELPKRQQVLKEATIKRRRIGLRGVDIGLQPLVVVADEIGNLAGSPKQRKSIGSLLTTIMQRGRSISCFVIWATQDPSVSGNMSVLPQGAVSQLSTKILLGTAKQEVQREVFNTVAIAGDVPKFRGFYVSAGMTEPQKFFVPNLYRYNLNELSTFEHLFENKN